jgi:hypothetical protein
VSAVISDCGRYRYRLDRDGPGDGATVIIMVNPSTADAENDDHTIRKLRGFGERNRWGRLIVGNLFAFRATDVRELASTNDPIGPGNNSHLSEMFAEADRIVCAWGPVSKQPRQYRGIRWNQVVRLAGPRPLYSIGEPAKCGHPCHPLTLGYDRPIIRWHP